MGAAMMMMVTMVMVVVVVVMVVVMTIMMVFSDRCQHCGGLQCFTGPVTVQCSTRQPLCFSHVTDMSNGERMVAKG